MNQDQEVLMRDGGWHKVSTQKDLPHETSEIIMLDNTGYKHFGIWDAHERHLYVHQATIVLDTKNPRSIPSVGNQWYRVYPEDYGKLCTWWVESTYPSIDAGALLKQEKAAKWHVLEHEAY